MNSIPKQYLVVGGILLVLVVASLAVITTQNKKSATSAEKKTVFDEPTEVIPTVDSSVKVNIEGNTDAVITIEGIPSKTEEIEYELSYNTESGSIEGVFGTVKAEGKNTVDEKITFGTCSSGVCRYHKIDGNVKGTFKFSGGYGQRLLEKEFSL